MAKSTQSDVNESTETAINTILGAEQQAQRSITQCREQAEALLHMARQKAHRISTRTDERITRIHQRCSRAVADAINQLQHDTELKLQAQLKFTVNQASIDEVVNAIAEQLTTD